MKKLVEVKRFKIASVTRFINDGREPVSESTKEELVCYDAKEWGKERVRRVILGEPDDVLAHMMFFEYEVVVSHEDTYELRDRYGERNYAVFRDGCLNIWHDPMDDKDYHQYIIPGLTLDDIVNPKKKTKIDDLTE